MFAVRALKVFMFLCFVMVQSACVQKESFSLPTYLFLGHIYEGESTIDSRIASADLSEYGQIWLGGDICSEMTREETTLDYLDKIFGLGNSNTHWTLGNHDIRNGNRINNSQKQDK